MNWLTQSWWSLLPPLPAALCLVACALASGALIGSEREKREKPAGMRTLIFVCLGATVFTMVGFVFSSNTGDSGRVAAQIVTGIGFLGAGVILHERGIVRGATTAATIWVTASIGMAIGAGFGVAGIALALLVRCVLVAVHAYEWRFIDRVHTLNLRVVFTPENGKGRARLLRILADFNVAPEICRWQLIDGDKQALQVELRLARRPLRDVIEELANVPNVTSLEESVVN